MATINLIFLSQVEQQVSPQKHGLALHAMQYAVSWLHEGLNVPMNQFQTHPVEMLPKAVKQI